MNIELIRLKRKLAVMEIDGANQVFMDLLRSVKRPLISVNEKCISDLRNDYKQQLQELEQKESKFKQLEIEL